MAPPSIRELDEKYLVISPMTLEVKWMTAREIRELKALPTRHEVVQRQIKELWADPTIDDIRFYDAKYIYVRRKGKNFLEQMLINKQPPEKIAIKFPKRFRETDASL